MALHFLNDVVNDIFINMLKPNFQVHDLLLRSSVDGTLCYHGRIPLCMINYSQYQHQNAWILLPTYIKTAPSLSSFQTKLKDKLMHFT